jgi:hypothetical protein
LSSFLFGVGEQDKRPKATNDGKRREEKGVIIHEKVGFSLKKLGLYVGERVAIFFGCQPDR